MATADWTRARALAPAGAYSGEDWLNHWTSNPDVFVQMLGDAYRVYRSEERKRKGQANSKGGRRRSSIEGNVEELFSILTPTLSCEPFPEAFRAIKGSRSIRQIGLRAGIAQGTISGWLAGSRERGSVGRYDLERLAVALDVHPAYFAEWRAIVCTSLLEEILAAKPNLSIGLLRALT